MHVLHPSLCGHDNDEFSRIVKYSILLSLDTAGPNDMQYVNSPGIV